MKTTTKKSIACALFTVAIGCVLFSIHGSIIAVIVGAGAAALACSIAEDINKEIKRNGNGY